MKPGDRVTELEEELEATWALYRQVERQRDFLADRLAKELGITWDEAVKLSTPSSPGEPSPRRS